MLNNITCPGFRPLNNVTTEDICPERSFIVPYYIIALPLPLLTAAIIILYYHYETEIKVWCYANGILLSLVTEEEFDRDKKYDAFVCYSESDKEFVMNQLRPKLENQEPKFKLCLEIRDWLAGDFKSTCIAESVLNSRRTIIILSPNFLEYLWGRMEFRTAHTQALQESRARVIVIMYGDVGKIEKLDPELKVYISMNTYVKWGDPGFWNKLKYYLPHFTEINGEKKFRHQSFFKSDLLKRLKSKLTNSTA